MHLWTKLWSEIIRWIMIDPCDELRSGLTWKIKLKQVLVENNSSKKKKCSRKRIIMKLARLLLRGSQTRSKEHRMRVQILQESTFFISGNVYFIVFSFFGNFILLNHQMILNVSTNYQLIICEQIFKKPEYYSLNVLFGER